MEIIKGRITGGAKKIVVYGPEGIGKSTFAAQFPAPLFIDTEDSTRELDIDRLQKPTSWNMLQMQIHEVIRDPGPYKTLVIDTLDWAERLCQEHMCALNHWHNVAEPSYGRGYGAAYREFANLINGLSAVVGRGINVVCTAHAKLSKFEQPNEIGSYDRWEMKLQNSNNSNVSQMVKEWADMLLFVNYKIIVVKIENSKKAQGGMRVMYTTHTPFWDAKNRYGLPDEVAFDYGVIAPIIGGGTAPPQPQVQAQPQYQQMSMPLQAPPQQAAGGARERPDFGQNAQSPTAAPVPPQNAQTGAQDASQAAPQPQRPTFAELKARMDAMKAREAVPAEAADKSAAQPQTADAQPGAPAPAAVNVAANAALASLDIDPEVPAALRDLMERSGVAQWEVENLVYARGYMPDTVRLQDFDKISPGIIQGLLVANWPGIAADAISARQTQAIPFN